jgi:2,4-dienoyl-CoA reductase (NADPH2)
VRIPGKQEFNETLRYFGNSLNDHNVELHLNHTVTTQELAALNCDAIVLASGVSPRKPDIGGIDHDSVVYYNDVIEGSVQVGRRVAIIGAGGIGFDVAEFLVQAEPDAEQWYRTWGIDIGYESRGGLLQQPETPPPLREVFLLQRSERKPGVSLGKTTGWIHRLSLRANDVKMLGGVRYHYIDDDGLHISHEGRRLLLEVDNIVVCAGQLPNRSLVDKLAAQKIPNTQTSLHMIGGAAEPRELDAERAIREGVELALKI